MARTQANSLENINLDDPFASTVKVEARPKVTLANSTQIVPTTGRTVTCSVGLKEGERDMLDALAARHKVARNALIRLAVRRFLANKEVLQVKTEVVEKHTVQMS